MEDISPGDPMEEGWVADTHRDSRARHWQSDDGQHVYSGGYTASAPLSGSDWRAASYGGHGTGSHGLSDRHVSGSKKHRMAGDSGEGSGNGGGNSGGGGGRTLTSGGGSSGDRVAAAAFMYVLLMTAMASFWWYIYMVVSKPELIGKKIKKLIKISRQHWMKRRRKAPAATMRSSQYRTLCVVRSGRNTRYAACLVPALAPVSGFVVWRGAYIAGSET
jgi:hypothetical protein